MSGLNDIGVQVQPAAHLPDAVHDHATARAILRELETSLAELLRTGKEHSIDLRSLPLLPGEIDYLKDALGGGEVRSDIDALGRSQVLEKHIKGVWWVTHHNNQDEVMAEFLEVSFCPDIVRAQRDDVRESLDQLSASLCT